MVAVGGKFDCGIVGRRGEDTTADLTILPLAIQLGSVLMFLFYETVLLEHLRFFFTQKMAISRSMLLLYKNKLSILRMPQNFRFMRILFVL